MGVILEKWGKSWSKCRTSVRLIAPMNTGIRMIVTLGGFLGRKCDGEPGVMTLWMGMQ
jgi:hypothetical protein